LHSSHPVRQQALPEPARITHWGKAIFAGLIAGALFVAVEMFLLGITGKGSLWEPVCLSASITLGNRAVATSTPFTFDIFFVGMLMHFVLSIWYAAVLGMLIRKLPPVAAAIVGAGFGLLMYLFHFYGLTAFYPWVANSRSWIVVVSHLAFGVSAAWTYNHLHTRQLMREAGWSPEDPVIAQAMDSHNGIGPQDRGHTNENGFKKNKPLSNPASPAEGSVTTESWTPEQQTAIFENYWRTGTGMCPVHGLPLRISFHDRCGHYQLRVECPTSGLSLEMTRQDDPKRNQFRLWSDDQKHLMMRSHLLLGKAQCPVCQAIVRLSINRNSNGTTALIQCPRCGNLGETCEPPNSRGAEVAPAGPSRGHSRTA
jgi:hypothetical protein